MMKDKKIEEKLRKVFDTMSPEQLHDNLDYINDTELEPLSKASEQRIKNMVKEKLKKENVELTKKSKSKKWHVAAAAVGIGLIGTFAYNADDVKAKFMKLFGFVPGVGVVEVENQDTTVEDNENKQAEDVNVTNDTAIDEASKENTSWYILENAGETAADDMIEIELKDAVVAGDELELNYVVRLHKITDEILANTYNSLPDNETAFADMYSSLGYDKYFSLEGAETGRLTPYSEITVNGSKVEDTELSFGVNESTEGARVFCINEKINIKDLLTGEAPSGTLNIAGLNIDFKMKDLELSGSVEEATSNGVVAELNGLKVLCVPKWEDEMLLVDFYALDKGEYSSIVGFDWFYSRGCVASANGQTLEYADTEGYVFNDRDTSHITNYGFDLTTVDSEVSSVLINASGLLVNQNLENCKLTFDNELTGSVEINKVLDIDGATIEIAEISNPACESVEDYDYSEYGYLAVKFKADITDPNKTFMFFDEIRINGEKIEEYSMDDVADDTYINMLIPLPMSYSEVESVEFVSAQYMFSGDMEFEIVK